VIVFNAVGERQKHPRAGLYDRVRASPPAAKALDPDPFSRRSLRHAVYAALLHFGLETAT
jgi:hypothetical protein